MATVAVVKMATVAVVKMATVAVVKMATVAVVAMALMVMSGSARIIMRAQAQQDPDPGVYCTAKQEQSAPFSDANAAVQKLRSLTNRQCCTNQLEACTRQITSGDAMIEICGGSGMAIDCQDCVAVGDAVNLVLAQCNDAHNQVQGYVIPSPGDPIYYYTLSATLY